MGVNDGQVISIKELCVPLHLIKIKLALKIAAVTMGNSTCMMAALFSFHAGARVWSGQGEFWPCCQVHRSSELFLHHLQTRRAPCFLQGSLPSFAQGAQDNNVQHSTLHHCDSLFIYSIDLLVPGSLISNSPDYLNTILMRFTAWACIKTLCAPLKKYYFVYLEVSDNYLNWVHPKGFGYEIKGLLHYTQDLVWVIWY